MSADHPKILLVEDEPDVCGAIHAYLGRRGYVVSSTASGQEALLLLPAAQPDIVLLDLTINDVQGREVLERLRASDHATRVIVITGEMLPEEEIEKIKALGISAYLQKPVMLEDLEKTISGLLGIRTEARYEARLSQSGSPSGTAVSRGSIRHELINLLGIIRSRSEIFALKITDRTYQDKSRAEMITAAVETMKAMIKTVDRAVEVVNRLP